MNLNAWGVGRGCYKYRAVHNIMATGYSCFRHDKLYLKRGIKLDMLKRTCNIRTMGHSNLINLLTAKELRTLRTLDRRDFGTE